jgi:hypothetical protein
VIDADTIGLAGRNQGTARGNSTEPLWHTSPGGGSVREIDRESRSPTAFGTTWGASLQDFGY